MLSQVLIFFLLQFVKIFSAIYLVSLFRVHLKVTGVTILALSIALLVLHLESLRLGEFDYSFISLSRELLFNVGQGFYLALLVNIGIETFLGSLRLIEVYRGNNISEYILPGSLAAASSLEVFSSVLILSFVFLSGFYQHWVSLLMKSTGDLLSTESLLLILELSADAIKNSFLLAAPSFLLSFCFDSVLSFLSRLVPGLNFVFEFISFKFFLGIVFYLYLVASLF